MLGYINISYVYLRYWTSLTLPPAFTSASTVPVCASISAPESDCASVPATLYNSMWASDCTCHSVSVPVNACARYPANCLHAIRHQRLQTMFSTAPRQPCAFMTAFAGASEPVISSRLRLISCFSLCSIVRSRPCCRKRCSSCTRSSNRPHISLCSRFLYRFCWRYDIHKCYRICFRGMSAFVFSVASPFVSFVSVSVLFHVEVPVAYLSVSVSFLFLFFYFIFCYYRLSTSVDVF